MHDPQLLYTQTQSTGHDCVLHDCEVDGAVQLHDFVHDVLLDGAEPLHDFVHHCELDGIDPLHDSVHDVLLDGAEPLHDSVHDVLLDGAEPLHDSVHDVLLDGFHQPQNQSDTEAQSLLLQETVLELDHDVFIHDTDLV
jgi:hypothetical protein